MSVYEDNLRVLQIMSMALNGWARQVDAADVRTLVRDCGVDEKEAVMQLFAAQCGVEDRAKIERYFRPSIEKADAEAFLRNPYLQTIRFPQKTRGRWKLDTMRYQPYELFVRDELLILPDGREIPRLGYFDRAAAYPAVLEDGREWMTVTPNEIATMEKVVRRAHGHVVTMGLGLGYFAFRASEKPEVARVTVIERDPDVIALFQEELLPQFPNGEKVVIEQTDAFAFAQKRLPGLNADFVFVDLWHDTADGAELYLCMKKLERQTDAPFAYWIEPSILALIRGLAYDDEKEGRAWAKRLMQSGERIEDAAADWLTFDMIR